MTQSADFGGRSTKTAFRHGRQTVLFSISLACLNPAAADNADQVLDLPLAELVNVEITSASRFKQKISEAPSAVEVLTAKDITSFNWRTLADALNAIRGLYIRNDRDYSYAGARGFMRPGDYNSRLLIMVDGRRMNDAAYDSGFIGEEFMLDMNLIERIEYLPGSGSSVYGGNALLGVVNVITKQGKDFNGGKLTAEGGSMDTFRVRGTYGKKFDNDVDILLNASQYASNGNSQLYFPQFSATHNGFAQNMDHEQSSRVFTQLNYHNLAFHGGFVDRFKQDPTASFGAIFNDSYNYVDDRSAYMDLDYHTDVAKGLALETRGFHHWYNYYGVTPQAIDASRVVNYDAANARWWGGELKLTGTQFKSHQWISGVELQYDDLQQLLNYNIKPYQLLNNSYQSGTRIGVYLQDEYRLADNLLLNAGARLDQNHMINGLQLNPRAGLIWDPISTLTTKLLYSSAFRAPNFYERNSNAMGYAANANNKQELITSYEAVAEFRPGDGVKLLGTLFYNDMEKVLLEDLNPTSATYGGFINAGKYYAHGFELEAEQQWQNNRILKLSWTHTTTQQITPGYNGWAQSSPNNLVKAHYAEPFLDDRFQLGIEELFVDQQLTLAGHITPAYHLMNINFGLIKPWHGFQGALGIYNVLNQNYLVPASSGQLQDTLAMDGRTARLRVEYNF